MFGGFTQPYLTIVFVYVDNINYMFIWVLSANINHGRWRHTHTLTGVFDNTITLMLTATLLLSDEWSHI